LTAQVSGSTVQRAICNPIDDNHRRLSPSFDLKVCARSLHCGWFQLAGTAGVVDTALPDRVPATPLIKALPAGLHGRPSAVRVPVS